MLVFGSGNVGKERWGTDSHSSLHRRINALMLSSCFNVSTTEKPAPANGDCDFKCLLALKSRR